MSLTAKSTLVFCATGHLGRAAAAALHRHGARVQLVARDRQRAAELQRDLGVADAPLVADVRDPEQVDAAIAETHRRQGRIDVVFNGVGPRAAEAGYGQLAADLPLDRFDATLGSIVGGQFVTAAAISRYWRERGQAGTLLLLTSSMSRVKLAGSPALSAASAAVEGLMRSLAGELGPLGGRAICINPTALPETATIRETAELQAARLGVPVEAMMQGMRGGLTGRPPSLAEVGDLIAFAASDAGAILNSHVVDADRGTASVI